jgi:phosphatidylglycerophosphate synthase
VIRELRFVPNQLTAARLVLLPVLWFFALRGDSLAVGVGLAVSFGLDFADGFVARRLGQTSAFGSKFDSIVDALIGPSAIVWLLLLEPETILEHKLLAGVWFGLTYSSLAVGLMKHRRIGNLHLQSSRIACVLQYAFLVDTFVTSDYEPVLLYLAVGAGIVSSLETLLLQLSRSRVDEHQYSFVPALRRTRG